MPKGFWIEVLVILAYVLAVVFVLPRVYHRVARRLFLGLGLVLAAFILLQVAAIIYLILNPISIDLHWG